MVLSVKPWRRIFVSAVGGTKTAFKVAEHSFEEPMPNSLFMLWRPFFARVKINYRSSYSRILTRVHAVAMATGLVKIKA